MKRYIPLMVLFLVACQSNVVISTPTPVTTFIPTVTPTITGVPTALPTYSPYEQYTIEYLRSRNYGAGEIKIEKVLQTNETFTRYLISYPSEELTIYGFANVPNGTGPFPIIVAIHGLVATDTFTNSDDLADAFASFSQNGYIVIHPYLRNYPPSDSGDNLFRVGMTVDVLNLIALAKAGNGSAELFSSAAQDQIGLWGYSMGGEIALRVLTVSDDIKATMLYASLSGDEGKNAVLLSQLSSDLVYQTELSTPPEQLEQISPANFYSYITSPIQLYHGTADTVVPITFAQETCTALQDIGVKINCIFFPDEGHSFRSRVANEFSTTMFDFYKSYLTP